MIFIKEKDYVDINNEEAVQQLVFDFINTSDFIIEGHNEKDIDTLIESIEELGEYVIADKIKSGEIIIYHN